MTTVALLTLVIKVTSDLKVFLIRVVIRVKFCILLFQNVIGSIGVRVDESESVRGLRIFL